MVRTASNHLVCIGGRTCRSGVVWLLNGDGRHVVRIARTDSFPSFLRFHCRLLFWWRQPRRTFREILVCADLFCRGSCFRCWGEHRQGLKQRCLTTTHPTMAQKTRQERPSRTPTRTRKHRHLSARTQNFGDGYHGSTWTMMDTIQRQMD